MAMLSHTVSSVSRLSSCGTTPRRARMDGPWAAGSMPSTVSSPSDTGETQPIMRMVEVLPADDAAPEAVHATLEVLRAMDLPIQWEVLPDGETLARELSRPERDRMLRETIDACDAALFGATSGKTGGVWYLRWGKDTYANVRPVKWRVGVPSPLREPSGIDYVIVRENLEDFYVG